MYATVANMIERFGETEMVRLSLPEDHSATAVDSVKIEIALADAGALINDYLRGRYVVPIAVPPESVVRATCILARYDLAQGERIEPTEQMRLARKEVIGWLEGISAGRISLDAPGVGGGQSTSSGARVQDRCSAFSDDAMRGW